MRIIITKTEFTATHKFAALVMKTFADNFGEEAVKEAEKYDAVDYGFVKSIIVLNGGSISKGGAMVSIDADGDISIEIDEQECVKYFGTLEKVLNIWAPVINTFLPVVVGFVKAIKGMKSGIDKAALETKKLFAGEDTVFAYDDTYRETISFRKMAGNFAHFQGGMQYCGKGAVRFVLLEQHEEHGFVVLYSFYGTYGDEDKAVSYFEQKVNKQ